MTASYNSVHGSPREIVEDEKGKQEEDTTQQSGD